MSDVGDDVCDVFFNDNFGDVVGDYIQWIDIDT